MIITSSSDVVASHASSSITDCVHKKSADISKCALLTACDSSNIGVWKQPGRLPPMDLSGRLKRCNCRTYTRHFNNDYGVDGVKASTTELVAGYLAGYGLLDLL